MIPMFHVASLETSEAISRQKAEEALSSPWCSHLVSKGQFSFQTPTNWTSQVGNESDVQLKEDVNDILLMVNATPKVDLAVKSLSELHDMNLKNFKSNGAEVESFRKSEVGRQVDRPLQDMMVISSLQAQRTQTFIRHVEFEDHWVTVYFEFRPSCLEENISTMLRIADSVWHSAALVRFFLCTYRKE